MPPLYPSMGYLCTYPPLCHTEEHTSINVVAIGACRFKLLLTSCSIDFFGSPVTSVAILMRSEEIISESVDLWSIFSHGGPSKSSWETRQLDSGDESDRKSSEEIPSTSYVLQVLFTLPCPLVGSPFLQYHIYLSPI